MTSHIELRHAILGQDVETIERLLDQGADVDGTDHNGITLLHIASMRNSSNIVQILINHGASINQLSREGYKCYLPMHCPIDTDHRKIVKTLLSYNADANLCSKGRQAGREKRMEIGQQCFGFSSFVATRCLGYSLSDRVWVSYTPLHCVVMKGHDKLVKLLIDNGANVNAETSDPKWTPLQIAVKKGYVRITKMLLEHGANVEARKDDQYLSPLCIAMEAVYDPSRLWRHGFEQDNHGTNYPKLQARLEIIINLLLEHGAVPDPKQDFFWKGLHGSLKMGNTTIVERILKSFPNAIDSSRDVGRRNCTLLHSAAYWWNVKSVEFLIHHGADVNAKDRDGRTPIFYVLKEKHDRPRRSLESLGARLKTAELLLSNGADVDYRAKNKKTPLFDAVDVDDHVMAHWLLMHNACAQGYMAGSQGSPNSLPEEPNFLHGKCLTLGLLLHTAIEVGSAKVARVLMKNGASVNATDKSGKTALHLAALKDHKTVEMLLEYGADVDRRDNDGKTALHIAAAASDPHWRHTLLSVRMLENHQVVSLLLKYGADVNITSNANFTALDYAFMKEYPCMVFNKILIRHVIKMTAANRFVSQHLQAMDLCDSYKGFKLRMGFYDRSKDLYSTCKAEYEKMRETKIGDTNLRFSDVLTGIHYARNETVVTTLESYDYKAKFPLYSDWIKHNFKRAQKRVYLLNQSATFFNSLLGYEVPEIVATKIFNHLSNFDLQNLIEAHTNDIPETSYEIYERNKRKNNVIVKGFQVKSRDNMEKEVKGFLQELAGKEVKLKSVRKLQDEGGNTYLVKFAEFTSKMLIMKQKKMLKGRNVFIENDLTERQQEIQKLLIERAKEEREAGNRACVGYMKLWWNDREFQWNEDTEELEEKRTGEKDQQGRK